MFEPSTVALAELDRAVDAVLVEDPAGLDGLTAVTRAGSLLAQAERLQLAALRAVRDVDNRELYALDGAGSTTGWLKAQPAGEHGQLALARQLDAHPHVAHALMAGQVSLRTAGALCRALQRVAALGAVHPEQLHGVLEHGLKPMLDLWAGAAIERRQEWPAFEGSDAVDQQVIDRAAERDRVMRHAVRDTHLSPAARLAEPFVLLARALSPRGLPDALGTLVDALEPEAQPDPEEPYLTLRQRLDGLWDLHGVLDLETGTRLDAELRARKKARPDVEDADALADALAPEPGDADGSGTDAADPTDATDTADAADQDAQPLLPAGPVADDAHGTTGPGVPPLPTGRWLDLPDAPVEGQPGSPGGLCLHSSARTQHDAFSQLLDDLAGIPPGSGIPPPAQLTITASLATLLGEPGAPPAELDTGRRPARLTRPQLARLACDAALAAVVLDAHGSPVGASGQHRHATARERRALRALWGGCCAVNGCDRAGVIPHHVEMFSRSHRTRLGDLVPLCRGHHHDIHDARRTLRLRDGRLISEDGWVRSGADVAA